MTREQVKRVVADTMSGDMTCRDCVGLVSDYLEEQLPVTQWVRFQAHLGVCRGCRIYLRQMKDMVHRLGTLRKASPPDAFRQELQRRFEAWAGSRTAKS